MEGAQRDTIDEVLRRARTLVDLDARGDTTGEIDRIAKGDATLAAIASRETDPARRSLLTHSLSRATAPRCAAS